VIRVGIGYDSHRFAADRPLVLGGVTIPHTHGLRGHSDADAVAHALTDAILGAAGAGDIGRLFPDSDPQYAGADSLGLLREAHTRVLALGWQFAQGDVTVILEQPKLAPHIDAICARLAATLAVPVDAISVKAKTNEGMGWIGRGEGVATIAVVTLERPVAPRNAAPLHLV
jgi:2-C-methyl-D-erythritol 2,4-cyclodiphosphate synthase